MSKVLTSLSSAGIARVAALIAAPFVAVGVAIMVYGPARLNLAVGAGTTIGHYPAGYARPAGTPFHPYVADLGGVFSTLVLVGLTVALLAGMLLVGRVGRRSH